MGTGPKRKGTRECRPLISLVVEYSTGEYCPLAVLHHRAKEVGLPRDME